MSMWTQHSPKWRTRDLLLGCVPVPRKASRSYLVFHLNWSYALKHPPPSLIPIKIWNGSCLRVLLCAFKWFYSSWLTPRQSRFPSRFYLVSDPNVSYLRLPLLPSRVRPFLAPVDVTLLDHQVLLIPCTQGNKQRVLTFFVLVQLSREVNIPYVKNPTSVSFLATIPSFPLSQSKCPMSMWTQHSCLLSILWLLSSSVSSRNSLTKHF
jgi:hypothetical protein